MKITINNEEVLCNKDFTINEEMLNTSSVILNNVYPKTWEQDKDYVSRFYYPKDYSKCKIFNEIVHPEEREEVESTSFSINVDLTKQYQVQTLKGQTTQDGTPTPDSPVPINITTGRQVVSVCGKNLFDKDNLQELKGYFSASQTTIASNAVNYTFYISCQPNTTYTITITSGTGTFNFGYTETLPAINTQVYGITTTKTLTTGANGHYLVCRYYHSNNATKTKQEILDSIQIEKNDQATTYEQYKGQDYEINLGKNLFRPNILTQTKNGMTITNNGDGSYTLNGTTTATANFVDDSSSWCTFQQGTYYISCNDFTNITIASYYGNGSIGFWKTSPGTFTLSTDAERFRIQITIASGITFNNKIIRPMIEKGTSASSYAPYKTPIYLGKIGTYQDYIFRNTTENPLYDSNLEEGQWYIHKEIGKDTITGSGSWSLINGAFQTQAVRPSDIQDISSSTMAYCNYYKYHYYASGITSNMQNGEFGWNSSKKFTIKNTSITSYNDYVTWLNNHPLELYYPLATPTNTLIEDEELINQLNSIELLEGLNNVSISSPYLPFVMSLMYNYQEGYTEEDMLFCGVVENTGNISLNPRYPHYCNLQVLDFKTFLSEGETLDIVIYEKTILEAIEQIIGVIAPYGFVKGNINIYHADEMIGAYSTKDKTAYDVFNYIADITQSRWTTRMVDENTIAIDFYDPNLMPQGTAIQYNNNWFTNNKIIDMNFNYSSRDYRNKQVMLSGEVYSNVETTEIMVADGYQTQFNTTGKIGYVSNVLLNGTPVSIITKEEYDLGYDGDFIYQPGNTYFESENLISTGAIITIVYYAIIEGREVLLNQDEIEKINTMTNRKGVIARYETRNDATTTKELNQIGQSYLKYKGMPEITLKVESLKNIWNVGERVQFTAPLEELSTEYMVKKKSINYITTQDNLFYTFELSSNFNSETEINYFDNQRAKTIGNIGSGEFISRNIDIENTANVIFYGLEVNEVQISGESTLQSELQTPLGVE